MLLTKDFYKGLVGSILYLVLGDPGAAPPPLPPPWIHADYIKGIKFKVWRMYVRKIENACSTGLSSHWIYFFVTVNFCVINGATKFTLLSWNKRVYIKLSQNLSTTLQRPMREGLTVPDVLNRGTRWRYESFWSPYCLVTEEITHWAGGLLVPELVREL